MIDFEEALKILQHEVYEEGHCSYIEGELDVAMKALEKQIPKVVRRVQRYWGNGSPSYSDFYCPVCSKQQKTSKGKTWYCERCGQNLAWEVPDGE
jgi:hypothetical protein